MPKQEPEEIDDDDLDEVDDDDLDEDDPDAEKDEDTLRAELKTIRASLAKANGQSAKRRKALRDREAELIEARKPKPKPKGSTDDDAPDIDAIRDEAKREGERAGVLRAKKSEARAALATAGVSAERLARAVSLVDLDDLDLDDDGLDGIDDEIEKLRVTWPELFVKKRTRRESIVGDGDRDGNARPRRALNPSELQAARLTGASR